MTSGLLSQKMDLILKLREIILGTVFNKEKFLSRKSVFAGLSEH